MKRAADLLESAASLVIYEREKVTDMGYASAVQGVNSDVVFSTSGGQIDTYVNGTPDGRDFNPGNIAMGSFAQSVGAIGADANGLAIFPSYEIGRRALNFLLQSPGVQATSLDALIDAYSPPTRTDSAAYKASVDGALGVPGSTLISALGSSQILQLTDSIQSRNGYVEGTLLSSYQTNIHVITFSEQLIGTPDPLYAYSDVTVQFSGQIVRDDSQPASPAVAATSTFVGPVIIGFSTPVTHVEFDAGYFDVLNSTTVQLLAAGGGIIGSSTNAQTGLIHYTFDYAGGISAVNVVNTQADDNGFSVDNLKITGELLPSAPTSVLDLSLILVKMNSQNPVFTFQVTRTGNVEQPSSVGWAATATKTSSISAADFVGATFPISKIDFASGEAVKTFTIALAGDFTRQPPKSFKVSLLAPSEGTTLGASTSATATTSSSPVIDNTIVSQKTTDIVSTQPFAKLVITDADPAQRETVTVTLSNAANGSFGNLSAGTYDSGSGTYTVAGTSSEITAALQGLTFIPSVHQVAFGQAVTTDFLVSDANSAGSVATSVVTLVAARAAAQVGIANATQATTSLVDMDAASSGGPSYLQWQYIFSGSDNVAMSTKQSDVFLHSGSGFDAIQVASGRNVLDGGLGSNFLTGGSGTDTFFTDARGEGAVWNTIRNFHNSDAATLWGFTAGVSTFYWENSPGGAAGSEGATLRANIVGGNGRTGNGIDASITFSGMSVEQASKLQIVTGSQPAGNYLFIYNPGV